MAGKKVLNLLPFGFKFAGGALLLLGLIASYYFIYLSIKPEWLQFRIFTVYSKFLEKTTFDFITNNQGDEIAILSYLVGFVCILLAGDPKQPEKDFLYKSKAALYTFLFVVFSLLFFYFLVHGIAIVYTVALVVYLIPVVYCIFYIIQRKRGKR
ncbi:hypothetical protein [uncultured Draconibacterium sp.]|uniref:hypothetical protein n=1 Tax=uncultured Draconibacterium sp. TaxID=1573823 RepID=UPI003217B62A